MKYICRSLQPRAGNLLMVLILSLSPSSWIDPMVAAAQTLDGQKKAQIVVHLSLAKKVFSVGDPIELKIEVQNVGDEPLIVPNMVSTISGGPSTINFELTDDQGRVSPQTSAILDTFGTQKPTNPIIGVLSQWVLLRPKYSITSAMILDSTLLKFLGRPGTYKLTGTYSSTGLFYPTTYHSLGLTDDQIKSSRTPAWSGRVASDEISFILR